MLDGDIKFLATMGWVANFVTILLGSISFGALLWKGLPSILQYLKTRKFNRVSDYVKSHTPSEHKVLKRLKQDSRIAIIDDNQDDFPVDFLRRSGYKVDQYETISLTDSERLTNYAVIYLDIAGVVIEAPKDGGLLLLRSLKALPKSPAIIAVSGKKFDPTVTEFFQAADDVMNKPLTEDECESHLREALLDHLSPCAASHRVDDATTRVGLSINDQQKVTRKIISCLVGKTSVIQLRDWLNKRGIRAWSSIEPDIRLLQEWLKRKAKKLV